MGPVIGEEPSPLASVGTGTRPGTGPTAGGESGRQGSGDTNMVGRVGLSELWSTCRFRGSVVGSRPVLSVLSHSRLRAFLPVLVVTPGPRPTPPRHRGGLGCLPRPSPTPWTALGTPSQSRPHSDHVLVKTIKVSQLR